METHSMWDVPTVVYLLCCGVSLYGFGLFCWWWKKIGRATEVYAYVTFLFLGVFVSGVVGIYSRYLHLKSVPLYDTFVDSYWWATGPLMVLGVLTAITWRMTRRIWILKYGTQEDIEEELKLIRCVQCGNLCPPFEVDLEKAKGMVD